MTSDRYSADAVIVGWISDRCPKSSVGKIKHDVKPLSEVVVLLDFSMRGSVMHDYQRVHVHKIEKKIKNRVYVISVHVAIELMYFFDRGRGMY